MAKHRIFIVAGEASGDLHGAMLMEAIQEKTGQGTVFSGIGGVRMIKKGLKSLFDSSTLSVIGLTEVLTKLPKVIHAWSTVKEHLGKSPPDLVILIDYPGFNLKVARLAKGMGLRVMYFITPQVWAWHEGRTRQLQRYCDLCAVILPFEEHFLRDRGVNARFVGHPLVDAVRIRVSKDDFARQIGLSLKRPILGILPGSRKGEIERHLAPMVQTGTHIKNLLDGCQFVLPLSEESQLDPQEEKLVKKLEQVRIVKGHTYEAMNLCDALILCSGTVTLEASILGVPHIVIYRVSPITYALGKMFIKVPYIALSNLVLGREIAPEFIQGAIRPETMARAVVQMIRDPVSHQEIVQGLREVRAALGPSGAAKRAADLALTLMG